MSLYFTKTARAPSCADKYAHSFTAAYHDEERSIVVACKGRTDALGLRAQQGARLACEAASDVLRATEKSAFSPQKRQASIENIRYNVLCEWTARIEKHLTEQPLTHKELKELSPNDARALRQNALFAYGTTLHAAMLISGKLICLSLGKGGCFLVKCGGVRSPFPLDRGDCLLGEKDASTQLQVCVQELCGHDGAFVCTDGLLRPYRDLGALCTDVVAPAVLELCDGNGKRLSELVSHIGTKHDTDVSLGLVLKEGVCLRRYAIAQAV